MPRVLPTLAPTNNDAANGEATTLLVLPNFHRFLKSAEIVQTLFEQLINGKQRRIFVVALSPVIQIPLELERSFVVVEHDAF